MSHDASLGRGLADLPRGFAMTVAWLRQTPHTANTLCRYSIEAVGVTCNGQSAAVSTYFEHAMRAKKTSPANRALGSGSAVLGYALRTAELELQSIGLFPGEL